MAERRVLDQVRSACVDVAARATAVRILPDRIARYAASLSRQVAPPSTLDRVRHFFGEQEATIAFVLTLDAINFGSGDFPVIRKRPGLSGYFTIASSLKDRFAATGPIAPRDLVRMTPADCTALFGQERDGGPVDELMGLFARAMNDLGRFVLDRFGGRFAGPVEAAGESAERPVDLLTEMPFFRDVAGYGEIAVPFSKQAQLTAADLALAFDHQGPGRFDDLDRLSVFADNLVPHVLRLDGVLRYHPALVDRIDAGERIPAGSREEVEIRARAPHAVESIVAALPETGTATTAMRLDYLLWNRGQGPSSKAGPRHRTRTVFS